MNYFHEERLKTIIDLLKENKETELFEIKPEKYFKCGYKKTGEQPDDNAPWEDYGESVSFAEKDAHFWLKYSFKTPAYQKGKKYFLQVYTSASGWDATNPQCIIYLNGVPTQGLDVNHRKVLVQPDTNYEVLVYMYTGTQKEITSFFNKLIACDEAVEKLYYDLLVPYEAVKLFKKDSENYLVPLKYLNNAVNLLDLREIGSENYYNSVNEALKYLKSEFYEKVCGRSTTTVSCIGHTHIDVAWLWTYAQTREKVQRSFLTALRLMEEYPEYRFMSSQPQLYKYFKKELPEAYEQIKQRVKEGRWEVEGAMWLEADCNLISGESMVRQIMHGKRFMKEEFGVDSKILWLPDVFGYSAALPQILRKSGVDKFVTSKIGWNETNRMPHETFIWKGIDKTEIFTHFLLLSYVTSINSSMIKEMYDYYTDKDYSDKIIMTYGYGDGGGGPTRDMIEQQRRLSYGIPGLSKTELVNAADALNDIEENFNESCELLRNTPTWTGELYLEFHRGTYTTMSKNKRNNRKCEFLLENAEKLSALDMIYQNGKYDKENINNAWETVLLNQFHDVIPGSSIKEVYVDSDAMYEEVKKTGNEIISEKLSSLFEKDDTITAINLNGCEYNGTAYNNGKKYIIKNMKPFCTYVLENTSDNSVIVNDNTVENSFYKLKLDKNGNISSLYDKRNKREVIKSGFSGNTIEMYEDLPYQYDAWEISSYYKEKKYEINDVSEITAFTDEISGGFIIKRKFSQSVFTQKIVMYSDFERIDFETEVDWHETHNLLKAVFPFNVNADKATYEIQYGNVERPTVRNTSWDCAKFEVCAHKWADISDGGYGIALMNDCKYGYSCEDSTMTLTLLKSSVYPNPDADRGINKFTYSIVPHSGDYRAAKIPQLAYSLNNPVKVINGKSKLSEQPIVSADKENIITEVLKKTEDRDTLTVRMYDCYNRMESVNVKFGFDVKEVYICDLMENRLQKLDVANNNVTLTVNNFEIVTLEAVKA